MLFSRGPILIEEKEMLSTDTRVDAIRIMHLEPELLLHERRVITNIAEAAALAIVEGSNVLTIWKGGFTSPVHPLKIDSY